MIIILRWKIKNVKMTLKAACKKFKVIDRPFKIVLTKVGNHSTIILATKPRRTNTIDIMINQTITGQTITKGTTNTIHPTNKIIKETTNFRITGDKLPIVKTDSNSSNLTAKILNMMTIRAVMP